MLEIFIPGKPQPQGSTRSYAIKRKNGTITTATTTDNDNLKPWRATVAAGLIETIGTTIAYPTGPVALGIQFIMPRRATEPKRTTPPHTRKPDLDKLIRAIMDAATGIAYTDDAQVTRFLHMHKRTAEIGEQPGAWITLDQPNTP